jgi:cell division protein FtsB
MLKKFILAALILLNAVLAYHLLLGENGIQAYQELKDKHAEMRDSVKDAKDESLELSKQIRMLKSDDEHLADTIRTRLNYVKDGEVLYLPEEAPKDKAAQAAGVGSDENEN